jgi:hypothetical protein
MAVIAKRFPESITSGQEVMMKTGTALLFAFLTASAAVAQNPLPAPNHPILFGYYKLDSSYGQFFDEPSCYTNMVRVGPDDYNGGPWASQVAATFAKASNANQRIYLTLSLSPTCKDPNDENHIDCGIIFDPDLARMDQVISLAAPYWDRIDMIELSDESSWGPAAAINLRIDAVNLQISARGLPAKPIGNVYGAAYVAALGTDNRIANSRLDWVGLEAYVDPPESSPASCDNITLLRQRVNAAKASVGGKNISLVMMAYDRNGCWNSVNNMSNLVDLQNATYLLAYNDPRVIALTMFNYGREGGCDPCGTPPCGGTHMHPELAAAHRQMGERILGLPGYPACGPGQYNYVNPASCNPGTPSGLTATIANFGFAVTLQWSGGSGTIGVQRMTNNSGSWSQIATLGGGATSYVDNTPTLPAGASANYSYRVYSFNDFGSSPFSNVAPITMYGSVPDIPVLVAPRDCITTLRPVFTWNDTARANDYYIAVTPASADNFFVNQPGVKGTSYNLSSDLQVGVQYRWKVKACNNVGCGNWASSMYFKPFCSPVGTTITAPLGCIATQTPTFTWTPVQGAVDYWLLVAPSPDFSGSPWLVNASLSASTTSYAPSYVFSPNTTYYAKIKTHVAPNSTAGGWSATISFTPLCSDTAPR